MALFIIELFYKAPVEQIDEYLPAHVSFLDKYYAAGNFLASGRKVPREGGIILARAADKIVIESILEEDPFHIHGLADYRIIEFIASKTIHSLTALQE